MEMWTSKAFEKKFAREEVGASEWLVHLGVIVVLIAIVIGTFSAVMPKASVETSRGETIDSICLIVGLIFCYVTNLCVDGKKFIPRLVTFSLLNAYKVALFAFLYPFVLTPILGSVLRLLFHGESLTEQMKASELIRISMELLVRIPPYVLWFYLINKNIKAIGYLRGQF